MPNERSKATQQAATPQKLVGAIKSIKIPEGYGFITDTRGMDYFFHRSALIPGQGRWNDLRVDQGVEFERVEGNEKGPRAANVSLLP